jgi:predicted ArsR family transcriptional regulator
MKKTSKESYAILIKILMKDDLTIHQMAEKSNLHYITVSTLMRIFQKHKLVHVSDWEQDNRGRDQIKVYKWGSGKDKKRFKMTGAERQRLCRANKKKIIHPVSLLEAFHG